MVLRWIGHRSIAMTAHYEEWDALRLRQRMSLPWGQKEQKEGDSMHAEQQKQSNAEWKLVYPGAKAPCVDDDELIALASELGVKDAMIEALEDTVQRLTDYIQYVETERMGPEDRQAAQAWKAYLLRCKPSA